MAASDYQHLIEKLPHRGKMRLIDSVARVDRGSVETSTQINQERAEFFGNGSEIESYVGVELIAQSAALPLIYRSEKCKDHEGMIVQVRSFRSYQNRIKASAGLATQCEVELMMDERVASVKGRVLRGESLVCEGVITLAMQVASIDG